LTGEDYEGLDGELVVGLPYCETPEDDVFNRTTGPVRRADGKPDFKFYVFDDFRKPLDSYNKRWLSQVTEFPEIHVIPHVVILEQRICKNKQEVLDAEAEFVLQGYEGAIVRRLTAPYKEGRATLREEFVFKRKPVADDEAEIMGFYEQQENLNEKVTNELGLSKRSGHAENKVGKNTLGGFVLRSALWKDTFNCGTIIGGTTEFREEVWQNQDKYLGRTIKYKYQAIGSIDKPRQPIMKGFRDASDMTGY
jgi:DNA ligase-1